MTKEQIETRIKLLTDERQKAVAAAVAYEGAIAEATHWLSQVNNPIIEEAKAD